MRISKTELRSESLTFSKITERISHSTGFFEASRSRVSGKRCPIPKFYALLLYTRCLRGEKSVNSQMPKLRKSQCYSPTFECIMLICMSLFAHICVDEWREWKISSMLTELWTIAGALEEVKRFERICNFLGEFGRILLLEIMTFCFEVMTTQQLLSRPCRRCCHSASTAMWSKNWLTGRTFPKTRSINWPSLSEACWILYNLLN